jgi:hypothetical protein
MEIENGLKQLFGEPSEGLQERVRLALDRIAADEAEGAAMPAFPSAPTSSAQQGHKQPAGRVWRPHFSRVALVAVLATALVLAAGMAAFALNGSRIIEILSRGNTSPGQGDNNQLQEGAASLVAPTEAATLRFDVAEVTLLETLNDGEYLHFALQVQLTDDTALVLPAHLREGQDCPMSLLGPRFEGSGERLGDHLSQSGLTPYLLDIYRSAVELDGTDETGSDPSAALMENGPFGKDSFVLSYEGDGTIIIVGSFQLPPGSAASSGDKGAGVHAGNLDVLVSLTPAYLAPATGALLPEGTLSLRQTKRLAVPMLGSGEAQVLVSDKPVLIGYGLRIDELRFVNTPTGGYVYLWGSIADREAYDAALASALEATHTPEQLWEMQAKGAAAALALPIVGISLDDGAVVLPGGAYSSSTGTSGDSELLYAQFILPAQKQVPTSITLAFSDPGQADSSLTKTVRIKLEPAEYYR